MSKAAVEQSLTGLIPTLSGPLPPELIDLALSLLSRSRSVAHSLKADEEIARPYACTQLACERLKTRLNLPSITPRPPCPPRIYKKLYRYLDSALPAPASAAVQEPRTPRKAATSAPTSARTTPRTPLSAKRAPRNISNDDSSADTGPPEWVMPTIRSLLSVFAYPLAAGHVYTGIEVVLPLLSRMAAAAAETPSKRPRRAAASALVVTDVSDERILGLIAVVLFYVLSRMQDKDITPEQFEEWRDKAVFTLLKVPVAEGITREDIEGTIQELMPMAREEGWLHMEWFMNVLPPSVGEIIEDANQVDGGSGKGDVINRDFRAGGSDYIGLATMLQDATDYLGARQREDYQRWKADILARVEDVEAS